MEKGVFLHYGKTECFTPRLAKISPEDLAKISLQMVRQIPDDN